MYAYTRPVPAFFKYICSEFVSNHAFSSRVAWIKLEQIAVILTIECSYQKMDNKYSPSDLTVSVTERQHPLPCNPGIWAYWYWGRSSQQQLISLLQINDFLFYNEYYYLSEASAVLDMYRLISLYDKTDTEKIHEKCCEREIQFRSYSELPGNGKSQPMQFQLPPCQ